MTDTVQVERRDDLAIVSLHRTEKRNALRQQDWIAVGDTLDALGEDDDIRCIILRGLLCLLLVEDIPRCFELLPQRVLDASLGPRCSLPLVEQLLVGRDALRALRGEGLRLFDE